jgi:hypothetical protein
MRQFLSVLASMMAVGVPILANAQPAAAEDVVTYEVLSDTVVVANIEFHDVTGRVSTERVMLPWRIDAVVDTVRGAPPDGSQVRADWRPSAAPNRWVSVRIIHGGRVICQSTLDIGNASCYGITSRVV